MGIQFCLSFKISNEKVFNSHLIFIFSTPIDSKLKCVFLSYNFIYHVVVNLLVLQLTTSNVGHKMLLSMKYLGLFKVCNALEYAKSVNSSKAFFEFLINISWGISISHSPSMLSSARIHLLFTISIH